MNIDRISKNEKRLDSINNSIRNLDEALTEFKSNINSIKSLNNYYGSKAWFKDKEDHESYKIMNVKAGVLSEDAVWNMNEDLNELFKEVDSIKERIYRKED